MMRTIHLVYATVDTGIFIENYAQPICKKFYNIAFCSFILQLPWNIRKCCNTVHSFFSLFFFHCILSWLLHIAFYFSSLGRYFVFEFGWAASIVVIRFVSIWFYFISLLFIGALFCIHQIIYRPKCNDYNILHAQLLLNRSTASHYIEYAYDGKCIKRTWYLQWISSTEQ